MTSKKTYATVRKNRAVAGTAAATFTLTLLSSAVALAQQAPAGSDIEEVSVTGSRLRNDSFTAPTPVMTLSTEQLKAVAPVNIAESLQQLPQFSTGGQTSTAVTYANLRNIGSERTLLLLDGRRHVPTFSSGVVDLATIPTALVARSEVVTGGASASWGSDAVSGVLNLILNDELEGFQGNAQYGESKYGDDQSYNVSLAWGSAFADGRGHVIAGVETAESKGIATYIYPDVSRPNVAGRGNVSNSNFALGPQFIYADDVRRADVHDGGLITSGPLRGTTFLPGGQTGTFGYGQVFGTLMIGGTSNPFEGGEPGGDIAPPFERKSFLTRANYDFSDTLSGFVEYNYSESLSNGRSVMPRNQGATAPVASCTRTGYATTSFVGSLNVSIDNAFLPDAVRQQMTAANINCFAFGRTFREEGLGMFRTSEGSPEIHRYVTGLEGEFANGWTWDTYVQYGDSSFQQRRGGNIHSTRFANAIDAVRDPATGSIVCRVNIDTNPGNNDPACVPFNMFGAGSPSTAAQQYVTGTSALDMDIEQTVAAFNVGGDLFEAWAGPISSAFGVEYREEELSAVADPDSQNNLWSTSNRKAITGSYDVKEVYAEIGVPLMNDATLVDSLDLSLAARSTDYSSSGEVTTWKTGLNWDINEQLRVRLTRSRDIRAGNIGELFTPTAVALVLVTNPSNSIRSSAQVTTTGNPTLNPEQAETNTAGIIFTPTFIDDLQLSADWYSIEIDGQIGSVNAQQIADQCYLFNEQDFCARIRTDSNGVITDINTSFINLDRFETSGVDLVAAYRMNVGPGDMSLRLSSAYVDKRETTFQLQGTAQDTAGQQGSPHWKHFVQLGYTVGRFNGLIDWRWYQHTKISNQRIEGFAGVQGANINSIPNLHYTSLSLNYDLDGMFGDWNGTVFARIDNLFDKDPPFPLRSAYNDNNGRGYRLGLRFTY